MRNASRLKRLNKKYTLVHNAVRTEPSRFVGTAGGGGGGEGRRNPDVTLPRENNHQSRKASNCGDQAVVEVTSSVTGEQGRGDRNMKRGPGATG